MIIVQFTRPEKLNGALDCGIPMTSMSKLRACGQCVGPIPSSKKGCIPEVHWRVADAVADAFDDFRHAVVVDVVGGDELEADCLIVLQVAHALVKVHQHRRAWKTRQTYSEFATDSCMHAGIGHEPFLLCKVEERPMSDARLRGVRSRIRRPCIQMGIEVDDRDRPVNLVERT